MVDRAFAGAHALFWLAPPDLTKTLDGAFVGFARPAAEAVRRHGVGRVDAQARNGGLTRFIVCGLDKAKAVACWHGLANTMTWAWRFARA